MMRAACFALTILGLPFFGLVNVAEAAGVIVPAEERYVPYTGNLPTCDDPSVLNTISGRFVERESEYWNSSLAIDGYDRIREIGFRSNGLAYIPRRYCGARVAMNDGRTRVVLYWVGESLGMIGWGPGVEWCVVGLDRNFAYAPACSVVKPFLARFLEEERPIRARY